MLTLFKNYVRTSMPLRAIYLTVIVVCSVIPLKSKTLQPQAKLPIVYHPAYNFKFPIIGRLVEYVHHFDGTKFEKIHKTLKQFLKETVVQKPEDSFYTPTKITNNQLRTVHSESYLNQFDKNPLTTISGVLEIPAYIISRIIAVINVLNIFGTTSTVQSLLIHPFLWATGGTLKAAELLTAHNWSINLGGGFHHAKKNGGEGFCPFADISLAIDHLRQKNPGCKILIVDLDAHQGNGPESIRGERDQGYQDTVKFFDMFSYPNYPSGDSADWITYCYPLKPNMKTEEYLTILRTELPKALN